MNSPNVKLYATHEQLQSTSNPRIATIDRDRVCQLVRQHKEHLALLAAAQGDTKQSIIVYTDLVNAFMAALNAPDREHFVTLYLNEMNSLEK